MTLERVIRARGEDYRAGLSVDLEHDRASREAGDRIECPVLALWGDASRTVDFDPLNVWEEWATSVSGRGLSCGHFVIEEAPDATLAELDPFLVVPAVAAVVALSLPSVGVITAEDVTDVSWEIIFLIGAMLSILDVMETTSAIETVIGVLTRWIPFAALGNWQLVAVLIGLAVGIHALFSTGSAAIVVALPIVLELAAVFDVNRLFLALTVLLVVGSTTILPFNTTAVLVSMDPGPLSHRDVAAFGLVTMALAVAVAAVSWLVYWPLVA